MMLNTLGVPIGRMEKITGNFPSLVSGHSLEVGGQKYNNLRRLTEGGFANIYVGDCQGQLDCLKVWTRECTHLQLHMSYWPS